MEIYDGQDIIKTEQIQCSSDCYFGFQSVDASAEYAYTVKITATEDDYIVEATEEFVFKDIKGSENIIYLDINCSILIKHEK